MVEDVFGILGTTLAGTFHIEEVIAEGGFGVVYRAEHVAFRAPVALKCLKIPGTISPSQSEIFVENFREEAEILFHLSAQIPEVVRPLHADAMTLEDGTFVPYIAMEWIEGKPLDSIIIVREEDGLPPLKLRTVLKMLTPIAHALAKAHRFQVPGGAIVSVTHCDLKPENILITERDSPVRAKVLDFGIAKARDMMRQNVGRMTDSEQSRPFTPSYGAPEQWVPKRYGQSGPWTDVWGLALTMVECLTGRPPIDGDMHAMMGTCLDKSRRPTPRAEGIDIGVEAEKVFQKALAVDPRARFNDIESFWTAAEEAADAPSSFERARRRRSVPTFDGFDADEPHPSERPSQRQLDQHVDQHAPRSERGRRGVDDSLEFDGLELEEESHDMMMADVRKRHDPGPELDLPKPAPKAPPPSSPRGDEPPPSATRREASDGKRYNSSVDSDPFNKDTDGQAFDPSYERAPALSTDPPAREFELESEPVASSSPYSGDPHSSSHQSAGLYSSIPPSSGRPPSIDLDLDSAPPSARPRAAVTSGTWAAPDMTRSGSYNALSRSGQYDNAASSQGNVAVAGADQHAKKYANSLGAQLKVPLIFVAVGLSLTILDMVLAKTMGGTLSLGPVRLRWIAAGLAAIGMLMAFWNLLGDKDPEA